MTGEPLGRRDPALAERSLMMGAVLAILAGIVTTASWIDSGASLLIYPATSFVPFGAFGIGVAVQVIGAVLIRFSSRTSHIVLGNLGAFLLMLMTASAVAAIRDPSGTVGLAISIAVAAGVPLVAFVSLASIFMVSHAWIKWVVSVIAMIIGFLGLVGYGMTYWGSV